MGNDDARGCFNPVKNLIVALIFGGGVFGVLLYLIDFTKPPRSPVGPVTAALTVIHSSSGTETPKPSTNISTDLPTETPTLVAGALGVGGFVQVSGTGGDGLRLRKGPGLEYEMQFLGLDGELFQIGDGPSEADGYTWWFVVGSYDESRQGWAASDFLTVVPNP